MIGAMGRRWKTKQQRLAQFTLQAVSGFRTLVRELYTHASAFSHARGHFRVSSVSLDGLRKKKQDGS